MPEGYSNRELELIFSRIDEKLDDIRQDIRETNKHFDIRLAKVEQKVERLDSDVRAIDSFKTKALALWSVAVIVASYLLNNFIK